MNDYIYWAFMIIGTIIAGFSQIVLKKAAGKVYSSAFSYIMNLPVIVAYFLLFLSTACSVIAYKVVPLSLAPVWNAIGYINVTFLSLLILKERPSKKKLLGLCIVTLGIIVFSL